MKKLLKSMPEEMLRFLFQQAIENGGNAKTELEKQAQEEIAQTIADELSSRKSA